MKQASGTALALLANRLQVSEAEVKQSLTETVFKKATQAQMTSLCIVANEYGLNPFVRELYAFPSQNGIVPMVSIDGWLRIINEHPQFAGMDLHYAEEVTRVGKSKTCPEYIEVTIHRKDRPHTSSPIREYLDECYRDTIPWNTMTRRMLRHKAIKEAGRVVMGLHGIFDEDEAQDVLAHEGKRIVKVGADYDVIDVEATEEPADVQASSGTIAEIRAVAATKVLKNGKPVTEKSILANLKRQHGYEGKLDGITQAVAESVLSGISSLEDAPQEAASSTETAENGDATPSEGSQAPKGKTAQNPRLAKLCILWSQVIEKDLDSDDGLRDWIDSAYGTKHRSELSEEQQGEVIEALERSLVPA